LCRAAAYFFYHAVIFFNFALYCEVSVTAWLLQGSWYAAFGIPDGAGAALETHFCVAGVNFAVLRLINTTFLSQTQPFQFFFDEFYVAFSLRTPFLGPRKAQFTRALHTLTFHASQPLFLILAVAFACG